MYVYNVWCLLLAFPRLDINLDLSTTCLLYSNLRVVLVDNCHWTLFLLLFSSIFDPTSLHIPYPTFSPLCLPLLCFIFLCLHAHNKRQERDSIVHQLLNNSPTGLPASQNSPVVVPLHLDPALEPPPLPPNTPTTQSSGLPRHGAQVGVRPLHKEFWLLKGSSLLPQQDRPD